MINRKHSYILSTLILCSDLCFGQNAQLPQEYLSTCMPTSTSKLTVCASGCDYNNNQLQQALDNAPAGTEIVLQSGVNYTGNFILSEKAGSAWTIIRSSALALLPKQGTRVKPSDGSNMPKLLSPNNLGVISCAKRAHHFRFIGIEFSVSTAALGDANNGGFANTGLVRFGDFYETKLTDQGHDFVIDRCYVHGDPKKNTRRGMHLSSGRTAIIDSYFSDFHEIGADAQAIAVFNSPGPFKIVNNYLEASGENMAVGGADPLIVNLVPADFEIRGNYFFKPFSWWTLHPTYNGYHWNVKNLFELKYGRRVLVDGNIFENNWVDGQTGTAINLKTANQDGTNTLAITEDVTFSNNIVRHSGSAMTVNGKDPGISQITSRINIYNNIFDDINSITYGGASGQFVLVLNAAKDIHIDHNTSTQDGSILVSDGAANLGFIFTNNITQQNLYGIKGAGTASGNSTIATFFPFSKFEKNIMVGSSTNYPVNNFYPPNINSVNFVNYNKGNGGDYHLSSASIYKNQATDGMDIGANVDSIILKTSTVISGITPNCAFISSTNEKDSELNFVSVNPNPTNGSFKLRLSIAVKTKVTLIVYALLGEKVMTLQENTILNQGEYIYNNHIDIPGIYIIRAMIGNQESSYKLVVTK